MNFADGAHLQIFSSWTFLLICMTERRLGVSYVAYGCSWVTHTARGEKWFTVTRVGATMWLADVEYSETIPKVRELLQIYWRSDKAVKYIGVDHTEECLDRLQDITLQVSQQLATSGNQQCHSSLSLQLPMALKTAGVSDGLLCIGGRGHIVSHGVSNSGNYEGGILTH